MRTLAFVLAGMLVLLQYPLWLGKGGWLRVWELDRQVRHQRAENMKVAQRNDALESEVADLRQGVHAIEERARYELGMVRGDEVFVQIVEARPALPRPAAPAPAVPPAATAPAAALHTAAIRP